MKHTSPRWPSTGSNEIDLALSGSAPTLSRAQKQFNKLIREIGTLEQALTHWQDYLPRYRQRINAEFQPLHQAERKCTIAMTELLDQAIASKRLTEREMAKASALLMNIVEHLLVHGDEPALIALHDKYSDVSHAELKDEQRDLMQSLAEQIFGDESAPDFDETSPEQFAERLAEKLHEQAQATREEASARKPHRKSTKAQAKADLLEQTALDASQALREVYRKLVRELHPDREADPAERARKTDLMKQANQAYAARDLLVLLQLQLRLEQIDPNHLSNLAEEKLAHFNHVLKDQLRTLRQETGDIVAPFLANIDGIRPDKLRPEHVERALDEEHAELVMAVRMAEDDLHRLTDIGALKRELKRYRAAPPADSMDGMVQEMFNARFDPPRKRRR